MKVSKISYALLSAIMLAGAVAPSISTLAVTNQAVITVTDNATPVEKDNGVTSILPINDNAIELIKDDIGVNDDNTVLTGDVITDDNVNETEINLDNLTDEELAEHLDGIVADIKNKYVEIQPVYDEDGELIISEVEEARINFIIEEFFTATGYSPMLQMARLHLGKHWWNSKTFAQRTIDLLCYAAGMGVVAEKLSSSAIRAYIKKHAAKIVSFLEKTVLTKLGITVTGISNVINIALIVVGTSVGGVIAEALDRLDGNNNNYLWS